ncbi:hypothetical protein EJB05_14100 [Eragrostis curvula]|uniref:Transposase Tnp1/En/Spm-like domain-containing protein n=1 Tax=Eragrostis curvula TaxID=38414 RepID=A0A5J9VYC3_9POAL|nr:hypothetical protein EJB05_14100 [Eragrostis curvula]
MASKGERQQQEPRIHEYELVKLRQCMRNNARLQQLGIPALASMFQKQFSNLASNEKLASNANCEGSESEYNPEQDDTGDSIDDNTSKNTKRASKKNKNTSSTVGRKPGHKRVLEQPTTRVTRSKRSLTIPHNASDAPHRSGDTTSVVQQSLMGNDEVNGSAEHEEERVFDAESEGGQERCIRGINMGKGLQKLSRARRGKLSVNIPEGRIRPVVPLVAAKFATECNIAVRNHIPVLKHWKDYKESGHFTHFLGKVGVSAYSNPFPTLGLFASKAKFDIDTKAEPVRKACSQMMKNAIRQQRYRLKKKYFDPFPLHLVSKTSPVKSLTDEQWNQLVEIWKDPNKMATCEKNKANRAKVKFHQTTGSRSYMVHCENLGDKYEDEDPNEFDLFKECHYSKKKKGYTPAVQAVIAEMENKISEANDGEQEHMSVGDVVADVLAAHTKKSTFLQNVGIKNVQPRSNVRNLQAELTEEKRANAELRLVVDTQREQIHVLSEQLQKAKEARAKDKAETDAKFELLLSRLPPVPAVPDQAEGWA